MYEARITSYNVCYTKLLRAVVCLVGGGLVGALLRRKSSEGKLADAEREAARQLEVARKEAETIRKEAEIQAKDAVFQAKAEWENEVRERRNELQSQEKRLVQKEENLDRKTEQAETREQELHKRDQVLVERDRALAERDRALIERNAEIDSLVADQHRKLEQIAGLSAEEAKQQLMAAMESEARHDAAKRIKQIEDEAREAADKKAKNILSLAIQRYAGDYVAEKTVSAVPLPNDEMKGRSYNFV